jgi:hypothetical protein
MDSGNTQRVLLGMPRENEGIAFVTYQVFNLIHPFAQALKGPVNHFFISMEESNTISPSLTPISLAITRNFAFKRRNMGRFSLDSAS